MANERAVQKSAGKALNRLADGGWWSRPDMFRHPQLAEAVNAPQWQRYLLQYLQNQGWVARQGERGAVRYQVTSGSQQALRALASDPESLAGVLFPRYARSTVEELALEEDSGADGVESVVAGAAGEQPEQPPLVECINALLRSQLGLIERISSLVEKVDRIDENVAALVRDLRGEPAGRSGGVG